MLVCDDDTGACSCCDTISFSSADVHSAHLDAINKFCIFTVRVLFCLWFFQPVRIITDDLTLCRLRARLSSGDVLNSKLIPSADPSRLSVRVCAWVLLLSLVVKCYKWPVALRSAAQWLFNYHLQIALPVTKPLDFLAGSRAAHGGVCLSSNVFPLLSPPADPAGLAMSSTVAL